MLRFGIQSSNLGCVWLAGWLYRKPAYKIETEDQKSVLQSLNNREINTKPKIQAIRNNKINTGIRTKTDPRVNLYKEQDIRKREVFDRQDNINIIRKQIVNYLNLRNEGILMRDIAQAVGVSEKSMLDIQNNKISSLHFDAKNLETILKKFKIVFDQESASSF